MKSLVNKALLLALIAAPMVAGEYSDAVIVGQEQNQEFAQISARNEELAQSILNRRANRMMQRQANAAAVKRDVNVARAQEAYYASQWANQVGEYAQSITKGNEVAANLAEYQVAKNRELVGSLPSIARDRMWFENGNPDYVPGIRERVKDNALTLKNRVARSFAAVKANIASAWNYSKNNPLQAAERTAAVVGAAGALYALNKYVLNPYVFTPVCNKVKALFASKKQAPVAKKEVAKASKSTVKAKSSKIVLRRPASSVVTQKAAPSSVRKAPVSASRQSAKSISFRRVATGKTVRA